MASKTAKGSKARMVLDFESDYNVPPGTKDGVVLACNSIGIKGSRPLNKSGALRGRRDPAAPFEGNLEAGGSCPFPLDALQSGYLLKAMFGAPTSTRWAAKALSGPAVNKDNGKVGLPCTGHGIPVGAVITVAGTTNYNGDYTVLAGTTANEVVILKTYAAESFTTGDAVQAKLYDHVFKVGDDMPSEIIEKGATDKGLYALYGGCKPADFSLTAGGDGELLWTVNFAAASETHSTTEYMEDPPLAGLARFMNYQASTKINGVLSDVVTESGLSMDFGLDRSLYLQGGQGIRADLPEGDIDAKGTVKTLFQNLDLLDLGEDQTTVSLEIRFDRAVESLSFYFEEAKIQRTSFDVPGPKGILLDLNFMAYWESGAGDSTLVVTLTNTQASY